MNSKSLASWLLVATLCPQALVVPSVHGQASQANMQAAVPSVPAPLPEAASRITDVTAEVSGSRLSLGVNFASSDRPQISYTRQGKTWVAILNGAQLQLKGGNASFAKANLSPDVIGVEAIQSGVNQVQIRVTTTTEIPPKDALNRADTPSGMMFSVNLPETQATIAQGGTDKANSNSTNPPANRPNVTAPNSSNTAQATPTTEPTNGNGVLRSQATNPNNSSLNSAALFQPQITITSPDGRSRVAQTTNPATNPAATSGNSTVPPINNPTVPQMPGRVPGVAPAFRPLTTPPVGDIATTTNRIQSEIVNLGTSERVPRITLREAPAIEVLTLIARIANLSVVSAESSTGAAGAAPAAGAAAAGTSGGIRQPVSLDIENEPAQEVFNNILRITNLDANRIGNTIFVASRLPVTLRNIMTKSYRLNQITAGEASAYLTGLGAARVVNRQRPIPGVTTATIGTAASTVVNTPTESVPTLETVQIPDASGVSPLLKGLQVIAEERSNSVTLVGTPKQIEFAEAQLARLDSRKRQVAINVRIVDVQLLRNQSFSSQFSFGMGENFYTVRDGVAVANFGPYNPAVSPRTSLTSQPIVFNPYSGAGTFLDFTGNGLTVPDTSPGSQSFLNGALVGQTPNGALTFARPVPQVGSNPFAPGITAVSPATPTITTRTVSIDPVTGNATTTTSTSVGQIGSITTSLASLFQYPQQFLLSLQAQVDSGNAKVLTDPTLTVQEGESASVALTQDVLGSTKRTESSGTSPGSTQVTITQEIIKAGLTLNVQVDRIDDNGFVNLSISPKVSAPVQSVRDASGSIVTLLSERSLNSGRVRLRDGQTFILSGVIQDTDREIVTKVPILGDLPIIGALFRNSETANTRNEVIIVVTPRIIEDTQNATWGYTYQPSPEVQRILDSNQRKVQ
jgi:type II secretory pathway component GspD/PulD (secretin)